MSAINSTRSEYDIQPTGGEYDRLEPVTFIAKSGAFRFQDYLTCEQALELSAALAACALQIQTEQAKPCVTGFDQVVDGKLAEMNFIVVPCEPVKMHVAMGEAEWDDALGGGRN